MAGRLSEGDLREFDRAVLVSRQYAERRGERMTVLGGVDLPHPLEQRILTANPEADVIESPLTGRAPHLAIVAGCPCLRCSAHALTLAFGMLAGNGQLVVDHCAAAVQGGASWCTSFQPAMRWYALRAFGLVEPAERRRDWRVVTIGDDLLVAERV